VTNKNARMVPPKLSISRRQILKGVAGAVSLASVGLPLRSVFAEPVKEVTIGMVAPLSGPWARPGILMRAGAEMAIESINAAGGIKALGGAKMKLVVADAGDSADRAAAAVRGLIAANPEVVAGSGSWLSSLTLAVTEVTEREKLPWMTFSFSDRITERGFQYVFQTAPRATTFADKAAPAAAALAKSAGAPFSKIAAIYDNTPNPTGFVVELKNKVLPGMGATLVLDEVYTPPLSDATALVQRLRRVRPDALYLIATNPQDYKLLLDKLHEYHIALPLLGHGGPVLDPAVLAAVGVPGLDGFIATVSAWPNKYHTALEKAFMARTKEPYMTQDAIVPWAEMHILKEALELTGKVDRVALGATMHKMSLTQEQVGNVYPGGVSYDEHGLRRGETVMLAQWQNGHPTLVFPSELAAAPPVWPKA